MLAANLLAKLAFAPCRLKITVGRLLQPTSLSASCLLVNTQLRTSHSLIDYAVRGCKAWVPTISLDMHKAPARVLVPLLLLLLGTVATGSSVASHQGDSQDAHQLRKLLQSELLALCSCHSLLHVAFHCITRKFCMRCI